jgi:uncharacterized protein (UPF0332 family)
MTKTKPQQVDPRQVETFLADARKKAASSRKILAFDAATAYQTAYEAMLKGCLALMLSYGQRPRLQLGHHIAIIEFAQQHLPSNLGSAFALFDRMRRKRNSAFYDVAIISETEANEAVAAVEKYLNLLAADLAKRRL